MAKDFTTMTGPALVSAYNEMANSALGKELGAKPVTRFSDQPAGVKRCLTLASSIKARQEGLAAIKPTVVEDTEVTTKAKKVKKVNGVSKTSASANKRAAEFGARPGTVREKILIALDDNYRKMVPLKTLLKAAYGRVDDEDKGALSMSLKGANDTIKKGKLPYQIKKAKDEAKEISYGLYPA
jgi:hypothetical protein